MVRSVTLTDIDNIVRFVNFMWNWELQPAVHAVSRILYHFQYVCFLMLWVCLLTVNGKIQCIVKKYGNII